MFGVSVPLSDESNAHRLALNSNRLVSDARRLMQSEMVALAVGAILGTLVAVPYDQVFGLSASLCTALRSSIATAILAGFKAMDNAELAFVPRQTVSPQETRE